jgi:predicted CoA-binding protein
MSDKPERYSFKAHSKLLEHGFTNQIGVSVKKLNIPQFEVVTSLDNLHDVHTLTLYVGEQRLETMIESILTVSPKRLIFNPGTENRSLMNKANKAGIEVVEGCTLVMLSTGQF